MRAIGHDDEFIRTVTLCILVDDDARSVLADDVVDLRPGHQPSRRFPQPPMQQIEQHAAPDPESVRRRMQGRIGKIEHPAAASRRGLQAEDLASPRQRLLFEPQRPQHREAGRLKQEPRPERSRLRKTLEDGDVVTALSEECRRYLPRDPAADDADAIPGRFHVALVLQS